MIWDPVYFLFFFFFPLSFSVSIFSSSVLTSFLKGWFGDASLGACGYNCTALQFMADTPVPCTADDLAKGLFSLFFFPLFILSPFFLFFDFPLTLSFLPGMQVFVEFTVILAHSLGLTKNQKNNLFLSCPSGALGVYKNIKYKRI